MILFEIKKAFYFQLQNKLPENPAFSIGLLKKWFLFRDRKKFLEFHILLGMPGIYVKIINTFKFNYRYYDVFVYVCVYVCGYRSYYNL